MGIAFDPATGDLFVANSGPLTSSGSVSVINGSSNSAITTVTVGPDPQFVAYDADNGDVYVTNYVNATVSVLSGTTYHVVAWISTGSGPYGIAFDSANGDLYVADFGNPVFSEPGSTLTVISGATNKVVGSVDVGTDPYGVAFDPVNGDLYVANSGSNTVSVVSGSTNTVVATVNVGSYPESVAVDSDNGDAYVENAGGYNLSVVSGSSNSVVAVLAVDRTMDAAAYDSSNNEVYVADQGDGNVTAILAASNKKVDATTVGSYPEGLAFDSENGDIYAVNNDPIGGGSVSVFSTLTITSFTISPSSLVLGGTALVNISASGGVGALSIAFAGLPPGCTAGSPPGFACTPTSLGNFLVRAYVNDSVGDRVTMELNLTVVPPPYPTAVTLSPTTASVAVGDTESFSATTSCAGTCPNTLTYAWSLSSSVGTLSSHTGASDVFTAGNAPGTATLTVQASANGRTAWTNATIQVTASGAGTNGTSGFLGSEGYLLVGTTLAGVGVVVALVLFAKRRRKGASKGSEVSPQNESAQSAPESGTPAGPSVGVNPPERGP